MFYILVYVFIALCIAGASWFDHEEYVHCKHHSDPTFRGHCAVCGYTSHPYTEEHHPKAYLVPPPR